MQLEIKDIDGISTENADRFAAHRQKIDLAFRDLAIYETHAIDDQVMAMLAAKIEEVRAQRPDLDDTEAYIVAGRLLKQLIACYQGALNQLLP